MKQIETIQIWDNGTNQSAEILNSYGTNLTLGVSATFYYALMSDTKQTLATGNLKMDGEDYQKWSDNDDYAWEFIATKLNLVIVGDWVEPIVEMMNYDANLGLYNEPIEPIVETVEPIIESEKVKESFTVETDTEI